ncbi:MAG: transglutaminase-like domain-containing protein [Limisphaerales bacterium]
MRFGLTALALLFILPNNSPAQGLPAGWKQLNTTSVPAIQLAGLSRRLGGRLTAAKNIHYNVRGAELKLIELTCHTERDAKVVHATMARFKKGERFLKRDGKKISEISSRSNRASIEATHVFQFQPIEVTYRVEFDAVPINGGDYMKWNQLFNAFLLHNRKPTPDTEKRIAALARSFRKGDDIKLRRHGQGKKPSEVVTQPGSPAIRAGLPITAIIATIHSQTLGFTPAEGDGEYTDQTAHWPVDDPAIRKLAEAITQDLADPDRKVQAILKWFLDRENIRYDGKIKGSRYGVDKVIEQKFGHCWDYSDVFVTLCRASGVPARQVLGWHAYMQGHVWAEILKPGQGWIPVDPTSGMACGSEYIPIMTTTDGEIPLVYASMPKISVIKP